MQDTPDFDAEAFAIQAAAQLALTLDPKHLPGVALNLKLARRMAMLVEERALAPAEEPAPVFLAGR